MQLKEEVLERQQQELEAAAEEVASRQEALLECQDMLAELQSYSEAQQAQHHALQQNLQVPCLFLLASLKCCGCAIDRPSCLSCT